MRKVDGSGVTGEGIGKKDQNRRCIGGVRGVGIWMDWSAHMVASLNVCWDLDSDGITAVASGCFFT